MRGARTHAERADTRSVQARVAAGHPVRPFSSRSGALEKVTGRGRGSGAPAVGPQGHRASPRTPRTHGKHLSHSRGALKVSVAPGYVV